METTSGTPIAPLVEFAKRVLGIGRRRGSFGRFRTLFVLLFTTLLWPIVLVALVAFVLHRPQQTITLVSCPN